MYVIYYVKYVINDYTILSLSIIVIFNLNASLKIIKNKFNVGYPIIILNKINTV